MPTVASSSSPPQRPPPGDDLQELYDQVLSAFAEESSPSNFSPTYSINRPNNVDHDPPYSPHSDEAVGAHISSRAHPQSRGSSSFSYFLLYFLLIFLSLSPSPPPSPRQPPRQQSSPPLPDNVPHLSHPRKGPSSPTKASWRIAYKSSELPYQNARAAPLLPRSCPLQPRWPKA